MARILVIEDDDQMRGMLRQMLERSGYEVIDAPDGKVGMNLYSEKRADLIITDVVMPEKDGIETIMELRRGSPAVKIIAISGGGRIGPEDHLLVAKGLGAQYTFIKPFELKELLKAVSALLSEGGNL